MYIELKISGQDRLGGQFTYLLAQIIWAIEYNYTVQYSRDTIFQHNQHKSNHDSSPFLQSLFDYVDFYNKNICKDTDPDTLVNISTTDFMLMISRSTLQIKSDYSSYFKKNIYPFLEPFFLIRVKILNYSIPFDPEKTIGVHLRLDDCNKLPYYDGSFCAGRFRCQIDQDLLTTQHTHNEVRSQRFCNHQAPIAPHIILDLLDKLQKKYPDYEIVIITNPGEHLADYSAYRHIQNSDPSLDLYLLSQTAVTVLSKSTFSLVSCFYGKAKEVYIPLWGQAVCFGFSSKYDKSGFNYYT